jgi:tetratricopeptide (TPR) repeat protein
LQQKYDLSAGKTFFAYRNFYATEGLFSLASKPLFGVGPGNFGYASDQYTKDPTLHSDTGHNLFVDVFVENGMLAGIVFLTLFLLILSNIKVKLQKADIKYLNTNNVLYVFLFLAMLLNFQTDYTYLIHSFFLLFFVLLGLTYDEEDTMEIKFLVSALSLALLLIFNLAILSNIALSKGNYRLGFYAYPLNQDVYVPLVESQLAGNQQSAAFSYLNYYVKLFKGDEDVLTFAGNVYYAASEGDKALPFYERAFDAYNFADPGLIARIYNLKLDIQGQTKAKEFADKYFSILSGINNNSSYYQTYYYYRLAAFKVCQGIYSGNCPYAL